MHRLGGPQADVMGHSLSESKRLSGNPVQFPYSPVIPTSAPSELSDTESCERALASPWSVSDEVNLEDQAVRFRWLRARDLNPRPESTRAPARKGSQSRVFNPSRTQTPTGAH